MSHKDPIVNLIGEKHFQWLSREFNKQNTIKDIPDDILNWAIECDVTSRPFRLTKVELKFYREHQIPIPRKHPDQRHIERVQRRGPSKLFDRKCAKCNKDIKTSFVPDRSETVYCEQCYLKEVY